MTPKEWAEWAADHAFWILMGILGIWTVGAIWILPIVMMIFGMPTPGWWPF
jgi:hypothetical protein